MQRPRSTAHTGAMCVIWPLQDEVAAVPQNSRPSRNRWIKGRIFAVEITWSQLIAHLQYILPGAPRVFERVELLLLRLEDSSARQTMMISWCHYSDAGTSHRDREPICFGVQCSKISSARRRMCRNPCTICLLQYHLHTLSSTDVPTVKRRCGAVVKEVLMVPVVQLTNGV